jgi:cytochrome P450
LPSVLHTEGADGDTLSEAEVRDNLLTFMFAGHETSSLGLTYTFMLLAQHEAVGERLRREHETVLGGETPTFEHLQQLTYTEKVIKETMRLHPPSHLLIRRATADVIIGGYRIPEGTLLMLPQFWLHTDKRFYDAPDEFKPDRWTDAFEDELPTYAYFPFGARHCIGMRFAMIEMKLIVAVLAQQFTFDLLSDPDPEISAGAAHRPKEDVRVRVHRR